MYTPGIMYKNANGSIIHSIQTDTKSNVHQQYIYIGYMVVLFSNTHKQNYTNYNKLQLHDMDE